MALERSDMAWWKPLTDFREFGWLRLCRGTAPEMAREYVAVRLALVAAQRQLSETIAEHTAQSEELERLRAHAAELERDLAATQAALVEAREALVLAQPLVAGWRFIEGETQEQFDVAAHAIAAVLARPVGSVEALRAFMLKFATVYENAPADEPNESIVARLLGDTPKEGGHDATLVE